MFQSNDIDTFFLQKTVRFSDEPPDAYLYEARNVWSMVDISEVLQQHTSSTINNSCCTILRTVFVRLTF